ncbi:M23 family metallopeptidase [Nocardioides zeae]|uniref:M23 family metallopeptidase n=1 Tax=Nocardioides zeae TaxID=1457234 RepID=UPI0037C6EF8B
MPSRPRTIASPACSPPARRRPGRRRQPRQPRQPPRRHATTPAAAPAGARPAAAVPPAVAAGAAAGSSSGLSYPVNGRVTSPYGMRVHPIYGYYSLHDGVDFGAACGTPMYAAADGEVVERYYQSAWGNRLIIDNGYMRGAGISTIYNHATRYVVSVGQHVRRGQLVGYVGTTGWSTGCHLHFTVYRNGSPTNPMNYF